MKQHISLVDPTWTPTAYTYYDENLDILWTTSVPQSDEAALVHLDTLMPNEKVEYIQGRRTDGTVVKIK